MRKTIVAGNWKMNLDPASSVQLADAIAHATSEGNDLADVEVVLCPPFVFIPIVHDRIINTKLKLGGQTLNNKQSGAFTGEVSGEMLRSVGCSHVIVGHSERRLMFGESDLDVCYRVNAAQEAGLQPIVCVGETATERETGMMKSVVERHLRTSFDGILEYAASTCIVAYEPVWAIGTGENATPEQVQEAHRFIRDIMSDIYGPEIGENLSILYGGSLTPSNAADIFAQPDVDGGLIGGASLKADSFLAIVHAAAGSHKSSAA